VSSRLRSRTPEMRVAFLRGQTSGHEDVLTVEGVAKLLQCTIDAVRRIPDGHLPAHQVAGKHLLYLRDEVIGYVRRSSRDGRLLTPASSAFTRPMSASARLMPARSAPAFREPDRTLASF
jgi:excisionase family DNA binding protein